MSLSLSFGDTVGDVVGALVGALVGSLVVGALVGSGVVTGGSVGAAVGDLVGSNVMGDAVATGALVVGGNGVGERVLFGTLVAIMVGEKVVFEGETVGTEVALVAVSFDHGTVGDCVAVSLLLFPKTLSLLLLVEEVVADVVAVVVVVVAVAGVVAGVDGVGVEVASILVVFVLVASLLLLLLSCLSLSRGPATARVTKNATAMPVTNNNKIAMRLWLPNRILVEPAPAGPPSSLPVFAVSSFTSSGLD